MITRFRNWFLSLSNARRNAMIGGVLVGLLALAMLCTGGSSPAAPTVVEPAAAESADAYPRPPYMPVPDTAQSTLPEKATISREYAWAASVTYLATAGAEGDKAINDSLGEFKKFIEDRRSTTAAFADAVLDGGGKWEAFKTLAGRFANGISELFNQGKVMDQDALATHIKTSFAEQVIDEAKLRNAVNATISGYISALDGIQSKLLVDMRTDLAEAAIGPDELPEMAREIEVGNAGDFILNDVFAAAATELYVGVGKFAVSWFGSEQVTKKVMGNAPFLARVPADAVASRVVDKGLDAVTDALGYKPKQDVMKMADSVLTMILARVALGDPQFRDPYFHFLDLSEQYPEEGLRPHFGRLATLIGQREQVGLRYRLHKLNVERIRRLALAVGRHIFGQDTALLPPFKPSSLDAKTLPPRDKIVENLNGWLARYGESYP